MDLNTIIEKLLEDMNLLESKKSELIRQAAEDMEREGFEPSKICAKLTEVLVPDKASESLVRKALPEKYKQVTKVRVKTDGKQETEKELPIVNVTRDNFISQPVKSETKMDNEPKQETTQHEDRFTSIEDKLKEFELKYDNMVKIKDGRINELEIQVKEKDKEIIALKGQLAMKQTTGTVKKIEPVYNRQSTTYANSLFTSKTHDEYLKSKNLLSKPKT